MRIVEAQEIPNFLDIMSVPTDSLSKVHDVCIELKQLCDQKNGIGISAVQVGLPWKLFLIKSDGSLPSIPKDTYGYFVNCDYVAATNEKVVSLEGCLSLRSLDGRLRFFKVERHNQVRVIGYRLYTENDFRLVPYDQVIGVDQMGVVIQHEIDHHRGVLISDIGTEYFND